MEKKEKKRISKIRKLVVACGLCAIVLAVSTYAWFVGMKTVDVTSFDISISAIDGLFLSLDGDSWDDTITIDGDTYSTGSYEGNTNSWGGEGLIPMSTAGKINTTASRLTLFEKGSFTTSLGGFRLMASEVTNTGTNTEQDGYVVFDLFIKNLSGNEYYSELNQLNEEAIYLTRDSKVAVSNNGGVANTGIENSVRVAFAQIGRVKATIEDPSIITAISCATAGNVTGICANRDAQIWEPNDTAHVPNAISWYETSCIKRIGEDLDDEDSFSGTCGAVADGVARKTYAVSGVINYTDKVDVYDGAQYNGYTANIATTATAGKLLDFPYFTDTMKNLSGTERPTFITLAPNSITKVRVYIYLEGQDVDNYDFASLGAKISVGFGFTKERYFGTDVDYDSTDTAQLPEDVAAPPVDEEETTPVVPEDNGGE